MAAFVYEYPRPMVTVDCVLAYQNSNAIYVLLIQRGREPFKGMWALPGGFVDLNEDLPHAAKRELLEETGIVCDQLMQFAAYGSPGRDPRGHTISVVFYSIVHSQINPNAGDDAVYAKWFNISELPEIAFDHKIILSDFIIAHFH